MSGHACLLQDGRAARLGPGEFTIYDFTRPYELAYDSGVQLPVFSFPREMLALPADLVARLTAVPVSAAGATAALAARLSTVVMNFLTTAVAEPADQAGR
jgi:AraC-binding-like domain